VHLRFSTAGESHGKALVIVVEGLPAGLPVTAEWVDADLARRMQGYGRGARMKIERDRIEWLAGNKVPIRAGVVYDSGLPATYLTIGLGYLSTAFGIDLSYRGKVQGGIENFLMLGIRIFID